MLVYLRLLKESFSFAMNALRNNKLRTLLSLLGVTIGIFSIIAVLAAVDSLDRKITKDLSSLDKNTIYLMKFLNPPPRIFLHHCHGIFISQFHSRFGRFVGQKKRIYQNAKIQY